MSLRQLGIFLIFFGFSLGFFSSRFDFQSSQAGVVDVQSFGPGLNNSLSLQLAFSLHDSHSQNEFIERLNFFAAVLSKSPQITGVFYGTVEFLKDKNLKDWLVKEMNQRGVQSDRFHLVNSKMKRNSSLGQGNLPVSR